MKATRFKARATFRMRTIDGVNTSDTNPAADVTVDDGLFDAVLTVKSGESKTVLFLTPEQVGMLIKALAHAEEVA